MKVLLVLFLSILFIACDGGGGSGSGGDKPLSKLAPSDFNRQISPLGADVRSKGAASAAELAAVDKGLSEVFTRAKAKGYSGGNGLKHSDYIIFLYPRSAKCENGFLVKAGGYEGTIWDKGDGTICAAGQYWQPGLNWLVVVRSDLLTIQQGTDNEAQHHIAYLYDSDLYFRTAFHGSDGGHPIF